MPAATPYVPTWRARRADNLPEQARDYLEVIRPNADFDLWCGIPDKEGLDHHIEQFILPRGRGGTYLKTLNARGNGIFVALSDYNTASRRIENTIRVNHLWCDNDGSPLPRVHRVPPHAIVRTSRPPDKSQLIWRVKDVPQDPATHLRLFVALARQYGADENAGGINRVLRVPGFQHQKREPQLVELIAYRHAPSVPIDVMYEAFPTLRAAAEQPPEPVRKIATHPVINASRYVASIVTKELDPVRRAGDNQRNTAIVRAGFILGTLVGANALDKTEAINHIVNAYEASGGQRPHRARQWAKRQVEAGMQYPRCTLGGTA